jgi:hypothetical protein
VLAPKSKFLPKQAVDTKSRGNRNEYASVPPEIIPADSEFLVPDERCVNAKAGDDEENDDGRRCEDERAPSVGKEIANPSGFVYASEEGKRLVMADGNPQR